MEEMKGTVVELGEVSERVNANEIYMHLYAVIPVILQYGIMSM